MLTFPSARALAQLIRQQYRALQADEVLVVVEGSTDRRALRPSLWEGAVLVPARGRDLVVGAYKELRGESLVRCVFLVDCDNSFPSDLKGQADLVITSYRDLEADMLFELNGYERIAYEYLGSGTLTTREIMVQRDDVFRFCTELASWFGLIKDVARDLQLPLRIVDPILGQRRRTSVSDLPQSLQWFREQAMPSPFEIADELATLLTWPAGTSLLVATAAVTNAGVACTKHAVPNCEICRLRSHCNGHDLVNAFAMDLSTRLTTPVTARELDQHLRMTTDRTLLPRWPVVARLRAWEASRGLRVVGQSAPRSGPQRSEDTRSGGASAARP